MKNTVWHLAGKGPILTGYGINVSSKTSNLRRAFLLIRHTKRSFRP